MLHIIRMNALQDDRNLIKMENLERVLSKFHIKLHLKQREIIKKLYRVLYVGDPNIINV